MPLRRARLASALIGGAILGAASAAHAGSFADDGTFEFDPTAVATFDFEKADADAGVTPTSDAGALSGSHVLVLSAFGQSALPVTLPSVRATYRVSAWIKGNEVVGDLEISYSGRVDEVFALYPTGRVTSDGWVEVANDHLRVDGEHVTSASVGLFSPSGASVDCVEITPDGGASELPVTPNAACGGASTPDVCAVGQTCLWNVCRNVDGLVPPIPDDRDDVTDYLAARMQLLFGPYVERGEDLPASLIYIDQMRAATDKYAYWNAFLSAVRRLHDGHTGTNGLADFVLQNPKPLNFCLIEGDADLSQSVAPKDPDYLDVLVAYSGSDHALGLAAGDRVVSVDGMHPIAWARAMLPVSWSWLATSNHTTFAELASTLRSLISRYASSIDVVRCDATAGTCGAVETISIAAITAEDAPVVSIVDCDNRPLRHIAGAPTNHATGETVYRGIVDESDPTEAIYGMEWESLDTTTGADGVGPDLTSAVASWKAGARGVILDHRTGFGGTILAPEILWNFSVPRHDDDIYVERAFGDQPQPSLADGLGFFREATRDGAIQVCGSASPNLTVPVAVLITQDVSASDWMPQGFKGAPNTRIFGPYQTNGGFSTRYELGYWLSMGYVLATGDTFLADGSTHNGHGVEPDVVVLPKQSDLLAGHDTVFDAAITWIRGELP
ncbi:MAG TPA: S41 family peptidase [Byssovorax sp.]